MRTLFSFGARSLCALALTLMSISALAQEPAQPPSLEERVAKVEGAVGDAALAGHNAWMLTSSALVLFMTAPGLALFYSGLVRKKNVLGVMMQCLFLMGLLTIIWGVYGYSLAFGGDIRLVGDDDDGLPGLVEHVEYGHDLVAGGGVEVPRGFVRQDDGRLLSQGSGDRHALPLSAGELIGPMASAICQADHLQCR